MRKIFTVGLLTCLLAGPLSAATALKVLSSSAKGAAGLEGRHPVSVTFNQPVVALAQPHALAQEKCPLVFTPHVTGTCRYAGSQTLVFEPAQNWPAATKYSAQIKAGFTSEVSGEKLAAAYTFSFSTLRPQVRQVYPRADEHWVSLTPTLQAGFNLPMNPQLARTHAYLQDPQGRKVPLTVRAVTEEEWQKQFSYLPSSKYVLAFSPTQQLTPATAYTFVLAAGLRAAEGNLGLVQDYKTTFHTYPPAAVLGVRKTGCLPFVPQVRFASPVRLRQLVASMRVSPASAMKPLSDTELDALGYEVVTKPFAQLSDATKKDWLAQYALTPAEQQRGSAFFATPLSFLDLKPGVLVTVTLDKNLTDIYGNKLGKDYTFTITNDGYCPAADFQGGYGVLESYLPPRLPIDLMNMPSVLVSAARFNKENYIPFLTAAQTSSCSEKKLEAPVFDGLYTFKEVPNKTLKTYIDLARFSPTAEDSLVFSQLKLKRGDRDCWVSSTANLTDVGISFKVSPENILLWATSLETGEPLANLAVELRDRTNTTLWSGSTDMHGLARAPGWAALDTPRPEWGTPKLYAFVSSSGGDGFISTELDEGLELWRFGVDYTYNPQPDAWRTLLFTERGIYRPGETVQLSGITRHLKNNSWAVPNGLKGKVVVSDATGQEVLSKVVSADKQGIFNLSFTAPVSAHSGQWEASFTPQISGVADPSSVYTSFRVEAVKAAEFKITLQANEKQYVSGQKALFTASANYQFGTPLTEAPVQWTVRREMTWFEPEGFSDYTFTPYFLRENEYKEDGKLLASSSAKTDAQGAASFEVPLPQVNAPARIFAQAGVQSPAKEELFARQSVTLHPASFYLGAKVAQKTPLTDKPVTIDVIALDTAGKRRQAARVIAQPRRVVWHSVRKVGLSGRLEWVSDKEEIELPAQTFEVTEAGGSFSFTPQQSGSYYITLLTNDENGRKVQGGLDVFVFGKDAPAWSQNEEDILTVTPDKNNYQPGEIARLNVRSPYDTAQALVTVERDGILDAWTTTVKGGADYIQVPIKENYLPNVYVNVTLVKGRSAQPVNDKGVDLGKPQSKTGYVNLKVDPQLKKIAVEVKANKKEYRPGEEVKLKLTTKQGRKGVAAEVILFAVDEGMLALTDYKTPDAFETFYGSRPLAVFSASNRTYVIGQRNFGEKGENRGGGGSAYAKLGGVDLRSNFSFVPYFNAHVQTDAKGRAEVTFKLPDNLTRFRIMAVAVHDDEFGSAQTQVQVAKPLMISAKLPQSARPGDKFSCNAIIYNYADKKGELTAHAAAAGAVRLTDISAKTVTVALGKAQEISWPCEATHTGEAQIAFSIRARGESDGVKTQLTVRPVEQPQTLALYQATDTAQREILVRPESVSPQGKNEVVFSLASTALLNLQGAITYLKTYPYDCLEQLMSKIQPRINSLPLVRAFGGADEAQLKKETQAVLDKLPLYQHASGGLGYWKNSLPDPYVTAYALETAYQAKQAGFTVPEKSLQAAADWLVKAFNKNEIVAFSYTVPETQTARAQSVYALALYGKPVDAAFNNLYAERASLPLPALAYLLKAASVLKRSETIQQNLAQGLMNRITFTSTSAYFTLPEKMPWLHVDEVSVTALALDALLTAQIPFAQSHQVVAWLLQQRTAQGHWMSTYQNALVLAAVEKYEQTQEAKTPHFQAEVSLNGQPRWKGDFEGRSLEAQEVPFTFAQFYAEQDRVQVDLAKTGIGTLFYKLTQTYTPASYTAPAQAGFEVSRRIADLDGKEVTSLQAGLRYDVTLTVHTAVARYFAVVEDFIPAGVEIVNADLATEDAAAALEQPQSAFGRVERYEDRLAAFADYLPAGTHTFTYRITAITDGTFAYPSAGASLMYEPSVFGRTATGQLVIKP